MTKTRKESPIRLDKWLWAARFYKTRALARQMVQSGKVQYDGQRSKPSKTVQVGSVITLRQGFDTKEVEVLALSEQRRSASEAQLLYQETEQSIEKREQNAEARKLNALYNPHPEGRPDKKQRRQLIRMKDSGE
ncbi:ribosome-associated heat shock protein Hsp15 [Idiomarina ramblicola]|uniref:Heat shock protein 15 n=1 Tax=Idiomarina ramblicola TaxID=263724 RepID=A0A432YTG8_9GAMM|nr:ribosome-associated heat shock protein Hsp15 [Idiomarina ramblicola]RUO64912.1 heat-shock protein [Idiomarina ramblicola]